jgi:DNA polymerase I-like protein with 3'-5' exonuclease and polymerase domains/5'-3' exonuclease
MRVAFDCSSVLWTGLLVGQDVEGQVVEHNGRKVNVNSAAYGYENVVNSINAALNEFNCVPVDMIWVIEGRDSKKRRVMISGDYKANREGEKDSRPPEAYVEFNKLKEQITETYRNLGAIGLTQPFVEGDDVLAWLAKHTEEDLVIVTGDNDLIVLNGVNEYGATVRVRVSGVVGVNKYGDFDFKLTTIYKALVGDTADNIKGCVGFGAAAWMKLNIQYGDDGCFELQTLIAAGKRDEIAQIAKENNCKLLGKIVDQWDGVRKSLRLAELHPEWVNTIKQPLEWLPGMVVRKTEDERLVKWRAASRLVTAGKFDAALAFMKSKSLESPFFCIDFETTNSVESDDWLEARGKGKVDVMGSTIVSCGINFGANMQYGLYVSVNHADTDNCTIEQLGEMLQAIPQDKYNVAHNAAGFELPVAYNTFGKAWADNGWRGFIPNMVDTRIAASFWDENQPSHGLKQLSKLLLGYEQTTYEAVTTIDGVQHKMDGLSAQHVMSYGLDDTYTASGLWNMFKLVMQLEHTYSAFVRLEQKPMYLSALAYVQGLKVDIARLKELEKNDEETTKVCWTTIEQYLLTKGWEGTVCPVYSEFAAAGIKEAVAIVTGLELKTMIRTVSKLVVLVAALEHEDAATLAAAIEANDLSLLNQMVARKFDGKPLFNVGSPLQISKLLYGTMGLPVRLKNKPTEKMKLEGNREGTPRTDDSAVELAIKMGDATPEVQQVLEALLAMKSANTRAGLYWKAYPNMLHWKTGRMHPELRQSSTNTRRWAGSSPNIQQMDSAADGVRSCILADKGYVIISEDEQAQEVRLMAELCQDPILMGAFVGANLQDVHSLIGSQIAKCTYEEFMARRKAPETKELYGAMRKKSKITLFAVLYGATAPKIGETLGIETAEAQGYVDGIYKAFPGVAVWKEKIEDKVKTDGIIPLIGGTVRHLGVLINSENSFESSKALRQAGNASIQGSGANQLKAIMADVWDSDMLETTSLRWLFVAHDEGVVQAKVGDAVDVAQRLHGFMVKQFMPTIPSVSSVGVGRNYGQLKEMEFLVFDRDLVKQTVDSLFA